jgi:hypothetical protein
MADRWNALLLLDEADVYVESRANRDLLRNELVSVFLRKLEYYKGILIMTTNRVTTIDEAVASRIHLALPYCQLSQSARQAVWDGLLKKARTDKGAALYDTAGVIVLSRHILNGREVSEASFTVELILTYRCRSRTLCRRLWH